MNCTRSVPNGHAELRKSPIKIHEVYFKERYVKQAQAGKDVMKSRLFLKIGVGVMIFGFAGCARMQLQLDYDRETDFSRYKTYAWIPESRSSPNLSPALNDLIDARIKKNVNDVLASKGYTEVPPGQADFLAAYNNVYERKMDIETFGGYSYFPSTYWRSTCRGGFGPSRWGDPYYVEPSTYVEYYTEGTLVLDIIDRVSNKLVWRGTAVRTVDEDTPEALDRKIRESVSRLLEKFPPPPGSPHGEIRARTPAITVQPSSDKS